VLATGSAINATLFSTARLVRDASAAGELPAALGRETRELPIAALAAIALAGASMAMLPGITEVIAFGSGAFLAVYTLVNFLQARTAPRPIQRAVAWASAAGAAAAIAVLVVELARDDERGLVILFVLATTLAVARLVFVRQRA